MKKKINLNFENYTEFNYSRDIILEIIDYLFSIEDIYKKSCLNNIFYKLCVIDFVFCDDKFIQQINKQYRGFDNSTDVISFALFCDDENSVNLEEINLGEIIVSVDTARKQAKENNHSFEKEVYYLITHGLLHLLGFDHQTEQEYNFMVSVQNMVMEKLGYV